MATHDYPTGPAPTDDPLLTSFLDPAFLVLYTYLALVAVSVVSWILYRQSQTVRQRQKAVDIGASYQTSQSGKTGGIGSDYALTVDGADDLHVMGRYFKDTPLGTLGFWAVCSLPAALLFIFVCVLFDRYWDCQLTGIDNLCFFGDYPLSGSYGVNSAFFAGLWLCTLAILLPMQLLSRRLKNLFRMPCAVKEAQFVWVRVPVEQEVLMKAASPIVEYVRQLRQDWCGKVSTHDETVPVRVTASGTKYYELRTVRYVLNANGHFERAFHTPFTTFGDIRAAAAGLTTAKVKELLDFLGPNAIPYEPDSIANSIAMEFFAPFYLYQLLVYMYWMWFGYIVVGLPLFIVVIVAGSTKIANKLQNQRTTAQLTKHNAPCQTLRDGKWVSIDSEELVPGDVVKLQENWVLPSDMVVLSGSCVVNESALTGEPMPVSKAGAPSEEAAQDKPYDRKSPDGKRCSLSAGTTVMQAADCAYTAGDDAPAAETVAVVTATAINTSKGDLLSAILFPPNMVFRYDEEFTAVVLIILAYGSVIFLLAFYLLQNNGAVTTFATTFGYAVFSVSQVLSPLLPVAMIAGQILSTDRLKKASVFCLNPARIAIAGKIRVFCFDKTGTLTTDSLDFLGARSVDRRGKVPCMGPLWLPHESHRRIDESLLHAMASCHAVAKFGGTLLGNQVEVKMFQATDWSLEVQADSSTMVRSADGADSLCIVRRFEFDHARQAMSVVVRDGDGNASIFVKGSLEKITDMAKAATVPDDCSHMAKQMAMDGCYVLAVATRSLGAASQADIDRLERDEVEQDLDLIGLLAFRNELKDDSAQAISALSAGDVRCVMITGDNAQCGHYIAEQSGMAAAESRMLLGEVQDHLVRWSYMTPGEDEEEAARKPMYTADLYEPSNMEMLKSGRLELAVSGKAYESMVDTGDMDRLKFFVRVFARVSPAEKAAIVRAFSDSGVVVGMCGDGGNDCGALREAHAGVALSDADASVVSPFTSKTKTCMSVVELLKEGKCALHTNLSGYKFLIMYGQLFAFVKLIAFYYGVLPSLACYILVDIVAVVLLSYTLTDARPNETLKPDRPTSSLFSTYTLASVLGVQFINLLFLVICVASMGLLSGYLKWPAPFTLAANWWLLSDNWESTVEAWPFFLQLVSSAYIFSFGAEYKRPVYSNMWLTVSFVGLFLLGSLLLLLPEDAFTIPFHVASEQFNSADVVTQIPQSVWATYQTVWQQTHPGQLPCFPDSETSAPCSPAMTFQQRLGIYLVVVFGLALAAGWQALVVDRFGKLLKRAGYGKRPGRPEFNL